MGNDHMGPPVYRQDMTENITFPQLHWWVVKIGKIGLAPHFMGNPGHRRQELLCIYYVHHFYVSFCHCQRISTPQNRRFPGKGHILGSAKSDPTNLNRAANKGEQPKEEPQREPTEEEPQRELTEEESMRQKLRKAAERREKIMREKDEARRKRREQPDHGVPLRVTTRSY